MADKKDNKKKDNKKDKKEEIIEEKEIKEEVEETEEKVEDVKEETTEEVKEAEVVEEAKEEKEKNPKMLINIVAIVIIVITFALGLVVVFQKPSPKRTAKGYFELLLKNPIEAAIKYEINDYDLKIEKEKGKYSSYKITKVDDIIEEDGKEIAKVYFTKKGPDARKIMKEVEENLEKRKIDPDTARYKREFLKEMKKTLKEKKDQLEEIDDALILVRYKGERNWTVVTSYL